MKIIHLPFEVAGQLYLSVKGLNNIHLKAETYMEKHSFGYPADQTLTYPKNWLLKQLKRVYYAAKIMGKYDIYHYHFGCSILPFAIEAYLNNLIGHKSLVEYWGSDIRIPDIEEKRNPYYPGATFYNESREKAELRMRRWARLTDKVVIIADHSLNEQLTQHYTTIYNIGQRVDLNEIPPSYPDKGNKVPLIVHAPSHQGVKGTEQIENALSELKKQNVQFNYKRIKGLSNSETITECKKADIIIDQLRLGNHGMMSCEAMALGKPVICYIMNSLYSGYPDGFPIINATPDNIKEVLSDWISNPEARNKQGKLSRKYAEKVHDIDAVAKRLEVVYKNHLNNTHPKGIVDLRST